MLNEGRIIAAFRPQRDPSQGTPSRKIPPGFDALEQAGKVPGDGHEAFSAPRADAKNGAEEDSIRCAPGTFARSHPMEKSAAAETRRRLVSSAPGGRHRRVETEVAHHLDVLAFVVCVRTAVRIREQGDGVVHDLLDLAAPSAISASAAVAGSLASIGCERV